MGNERHVKIDNQGQQSVAKKAFWLAGASRFERYAATQAGLNRIEGDVSKNDQTDRTLGAKIPDRN
jgi:hypothetical protein